MNTKQHSDHSAVAQKSNPAEHPAPVTRRLYNVVVINERAGHTVQLNVSPVTHGEGCTWLRKLTKYSWRRAQLVEIA